jgi:hypothetical protein
MNASPALSQMLQPQQPSTSIICWSSRTGMVWFCPEGVVRVVEEAEKTSLHLSSECTGLLYQKGSGGQRHLSFRRTHHQQSGWHWQSSQSLNVINCQVFPSTLNASCPQIT